jgi:hypothetical protein
MIGAAGLLIATGCSCSGPDHWAQRSPTIPPDSLRSSDQPALAAAPESSRTGASGGASGGVSGAVVAAPDPPPQN